MSKYVVICAAEGGEKNWGYFRHDYDENSVFCAAEGGGNFCGLGLFWEVGLNFSALPHPPVPDHVTQTQVSIARSLSTIT